MRFIYPLILGRDCISKGSIRYDSPPTAELLNQRHPIPGRINRDLSAHRLGQTTYHYQSQAGGTWWYKATVRALGLGTTSYLKA